MRASPLRVRMAGSSVPGMAHEREDPQTLSGEDAVRSVGEMLDELRSIGLIEDYDRCPGVPVFDIELPDGRWLQIKVRA